MEDSHGLSEMEIINQTMRHFYSFWFHGMILAEDIFRDLLVVDIGYRLHFQLTSFNYYNLFLIIVRFLSDYLNLV